MAKRKRKRKLEVNVGSQPGQKTGERNECFMGHRARLTHVYLPFYGSILFSLFFHAEVDNYTSAIYADKYETIYRWEIN